MKEQLEKLTQTVKETRLVERLMAANSTDERVKICEEAKKTPEFQEFMDRYGEVVEAQPVDVDYMVSSDEFTCTKENAVAIAVIFIIEGIDDIDMFDDDGIDEFFYALTRNCARRFFMPIIHRKFYEKLTCITLYK